MPARTCLASSVSKSLRNHRSLYLLALIGVLALTAWATHAYAGSNTTANSPLTPALRLAIGTANLEGTDQAVDSTSASALLPLWKLLAQLSISGTAAPQEITAVVEEIQLSMTAAQVKSIDGMSISMVTTGLVKTK